MKPTDAKPQIVYTHEGEENIYGAMVLEGNKARLNVFANPAGNSDAYITVDIAQPVEMEVSENDNVQTVEMADLRLSKVSMSMKVGESIKLTARIEPDNASDKNVVWSSDDETVAVVAQDGTLTAKSEGQAQIKVKAANSEMSAVCTVNVTDEKESGWVVVDGEFYWYEKGVVQGCESDEKDYRGKEINDPETDTWYWLDSVDGGKMAVSKDVYQSSLAGDWGDELNEKGERIGKWVRYDGQGHMIKGWCAGEGAEAIKIASPDQAGGKAVYYFDPIYGTMAKGDCVIDGQTYHFDQGNGILAR